MVLSPVRAEVRRYRVQLEIMRQGHELLDQRAFWVQEQIPRPLELAGLPAATSVTLSVTREVGTANLILYFQVVGPPAAAYQELTTPRLVLGPDSQPPAFCFALQGQVFRISVTSLKVQVLE
ncbi:hypothetical protein DYH09_16475 [bacterium CPR1]|nr:hypothetical protein [bacterium CPR1]